MKKNTIMLLGIISILFGVLPIVIYWLNFTNAIDLHQYPSIKLSKLNENWGSFGSFLSGTSGAIFSFFSLIAVLYSLFITQKMSLIQLKLSHDEQLTNEFNLLLDVLINMIENKKHQDIYKNPVDFELFKKLIYIDICVRAKKDTVIQKKIDYTYLLILSRNAFKGKDISDFKKESDIYSVLLARIGSATDSLAEAFIAILNSKLNEDIRFFLNTEQMSDDEDYKSRRLFHSRVPFVIPKDLELELRKDFER